MAQDPRCVVCLAGDWALPHRPAGPTPWLDRLLAASVTFPQLIAAAAASADNRRALLSSRWAHTTGDLPTLADWLPASEVRDTPSDEVLGTAWVDDAWLLLVALPAGGGLLDGDLRGRLVVHGPGVTAGVRDTLVSVLDVVPTLLAAAGVARPRGLDGRSLLGQVTGATRAPHRQWVFAEELVVGGGARTVRTERWQYVRRLAGLAVASEALYDLHEDPAEQHNLAGEAMLGSTLRDLRAILDDWMEASGDPAWPLDEPPARRGADRE